MPYAHRGSILSTTCRVLNLVENLTRSQKISCVFFKTGLTKRLCSFWCHGEEGPTGAPHAGPGGTEHLPVLVAPPCAKVWDQGQLHGKVRQRDFSQCSHALGTALPLPSWSGPSLPSLAVHEPPVEGNGREHTHSVLWLIGKDKLPVLHWAGTIWTENPTLAL